MGVFRNLGQIVQSLFNPEEAATKQVERQREQSVPRNLGNGVEGLVEALIHLNLKVANATRTSSDSLVESLGAHWNLQLDPECVFLLRCEFYCFYLHLLDYYSFALLGSESRDLVVDSSVGAGFRKLVRASFHWNDDEEVKSAVEDVLGLYDRRTSEYGDSREIGLENIENLLETNSYLSTGTKDASSREPRAKVSRLFRNIYGFLQEAVPGWTHKSEMAAEGANALGSSVDEMSYTLLYPPFMVAVLHGFKTINYSAELEKLRPLIR